MKQRLNRRSRLHVTARVVIGQGRAHGRQGWVTQSVVAHAMGLRPGCYVLGILNELHKKGVLDKQEDMLTNQSLRYTFRIAGYPRNTGLGCL